MMRLPAQDNCFSGQFNVPPSKRFSNTGLITIVINRPGIQQLTPFDALKLFATQAGVHHAPRQRLQGTPSWR